MFLALAVLGIAVSQPGETEAGPRNQSAAAGSTAERRAYRPKVATGEDRTRAFYSLDLNDDGAVSLAEAAGYAEIVTRFDRADRNRDGRLTLAEFETLSKPPTTKASKKDLRRREATARTQ